MTTTDNLTDEQRAALGRDAYEHSLMRAASPANPTPGPLWEDLGEGLRDVYTEQALRSYLAGRDDERAKWRERVREWESTMAWEHLRVLCPEAFDATGGESDGE